MDHPDRLKYFSVIDKLRGLGINEELPLPQIVVIGDQSSGKSSLLEGLINLPFPIASELCTRFATQLVLRRAPEEESKVKASIIPGDSSFDNEDEMSHLLEFSFECEKKEFTDAKFSWILDTAAEHMGLPNSDLADTENLAKRFSDAILRVELSGPEESHLSVVDVPGLFHNPTKYQTKEDLQLIRDLIQTYTINPRTIILAVMDARNNLANQEVFKMARAADPEGKRTVGIITKCDALQKGDEASVLKIAENGVEKLMHGWFVVRNRSTQEIQGGVTIEQRHKNEKKFFKTEPWNELSKSRAGIAALKPFLGQLLFEHICREFPTLIKEIEKLHQETLKQEKALGPSRRTPVEQRQYLMKLATKYQQDVSNALSGNYDARIDLQTSQSLRTRLRHLADEFQFQLTSNGHTRQFRNVDGSGDESYETDDFPEDDESKWPDKKTEDICDWILGVYLNSRGPELPGTVNPAIMGAVFRQQTINWEPISQRYVSKAVEVARAYNKQECQVFEAEEAVQNVISDHLERQLMITIDQVNQQLEELLAGERGGILQTLNHYYADNLNRARADRIIARLKKMGFESGRSYTVNVEHLASTVHLSNEQQAVNDIHDVLKAYYKVALKRFMDYVPISVVERKLLGPDGPLRSFSPEYVGGLSDTQLAHMAGESYETSSTREELATKAARYLEALEIARSI